MSSLAITRLFRFRIIAVILAGVVLLCLVWNFRSKPTISSKAWMSEQTVQFFLRRQRIPGEDAAQIRWFHAANSRSKLSEALTGSAHMIEADILMRGHDPEEPIMAHPPETDSDITLSEWLKEVMASDKGIKLDFKSARAVAPSMAVLEEVRAQLDRPVWLNADVLAGPGGKATPLHPQSFLDAAGSASRDHVLSLGWTTGWQADTDNPGYSWEMVRSMQEVCRTLEQPVTFPVRAALLGQSVHQLLWLLQQSDRYSLTVWTGQSDLFAVSDLLPYRTAVDQSRIFYDLPDSQMSALRSSSGFS